MRARVQPRAAPAALQIATCLGVTSTQVQAKRMALLTRVLGTPLLRAFQAHHRCSGLTLPSSVSLSLVLSGPPHTSHHIRSGPPPGPAPAGRTSARARLPPGLAPTSAWRHPATSPASAGRPTGKASLMPQGEPAPSLPCFLDHIFISLNCPARPGNPTPTDLCKRRQFTDLEAKLREGQGCQEAEPGPRSKLSWRLSECPRPRPRETPWRPCSDPSPQPHTQEGKALSSQQQLSKSRGGPWDPHWGWGQEASGWGQGRSGVSESTQTTDSVGGGRMLTVLAEEPGK